MEAPARRRLSRLEIAALCAFVFVLLLGVSYHLRMSGLNAKIDAKIAEFKARGWPTTLQELDGYYKHPAGENASATYMEAASKLSSTGYDSKLVPIVGAAVAPKPWERMPPEMKAESQKCLAANSEALPLLHKAEAIKECRHPWDLQRMNTDLSPLRQMARLLSLDSAIALEDGGSERSMRDVQSIFGIARSLEGEPLIVSSFVSLSCVAIGIDAMRSALSNPCVSWSREQLSFLEGRLLEFEKSLSLKEAMIGEGCYTLSNFDKMGELEILLAGSSSDPLEAIPAKVAYGLLSALGFKTEAKLKFLEIWEWTVEAAGKTPEEEYRLLKGVDSKLAAFSMALRAFLPYSGYYLGLGERHLEMVASLRAARVALAAERYRMDNGSLPESLERLVPGYIDSIPLDPFDSKPLKYKVGTLKCVRDMSALKKGAKWIEGEGFVVYSIGRNGIDDGAEGCFESLKDVCFPVVRDGVK